MSSTAYGYTCIYCNSWVPATTTHICPKLQPPNMTPIPIIDYESLPRIAAALEGAQEQLRRLVEAIEGVVL
jgi:hypothetical protein